MSEQHGGPVTLKPIGEIANFIRGLIPANIPESYALKPMFESVASEENIRRGVVAFRDFLYLFCDRLASDGDLYFTPQKNPKSPADYPFLHHLADLLTDIGYHGKLAESGDLLLVTKIPSFTALTDEKGSVKKPKNPASKLMGCLRFLEYCGFSFTGIDLQAKKLECSEDEWFKVSYPNDPIMLTGLKAMSVADAEPRGDRWRNGWRNNDVFLRCDYRILKAEDTDALDVLTDFVHPLHETVQKSAIELHQRYTGMGMTCVTFMSLFELHFTYSYTKNSRRTLSSQDIYQLRLWEFALSVKDGYGLVVRTKKSEQYADVIKELPLYLREKIEKGYGCDRKLRNEPCQGGCQGIRIPLDDKVFALKQDIEKWLDQEVSYLVGK